MTLSSSSNKSVRAAAILTGSYVASSLLNVSQTTTQKVTYYINFTIGSLTNGLFKPEVSIDGSNWYDAAHTVAGTTASPGPLTLDATGKVAMTVDCTGAKLVRISVKGTGTATSSSATIVAAWQRS